MTSEHKVVSPRDVQGIFNGVLNDLKSYKKDPFSTAIIHDLAELLEDNSAVGWVGSDILHEAMLASHDLIENNSFPQWDLDEIINLLDGFAVFESITIPGRFMVNKETGELIMVPLRAISWQYDHGYEEYTFQFYVDNDDSHEIAGESRSVSAGDLRLVESIRIASNVVINKENLLGYTLLAGVDHEAAAHFSSALLLLFCVFVISQSNGVGEVEVVGTRPVR